MSCEKDNKGSIISIWFELELTYFIHKPKHNHRVYSIALDSSDFEFNPKYSGIWMDCIFYINLNINSFTSLRMAINFAMYTIEFYSEIRNSSP